MKRRPSRLNDQSSLDKTTVCLISGKHCALLSCLQLCLTFFQTLRRAQTPRAVQERSATAATSCPPTTSDTTRVASTTGCPGTGRRAPSPCPSTASTPSPPDTSGEIQIPRQIQIPTWTGVSSGSRTSLPAGPCTTPRRTPTSTTARASARFAAFFASVRQF